MSWRWRFQKRGGHVHINVFVGKRPEVTHAKCGELVMSEADFDDFRSRSEHWITFIDMN